jgi:hypothetical protein
MRTNRIPIAPADGDIEETVKLFQSKYRQVITENNKHDTEDEGSGGPVPPCILPSGWMKRLKKPGKVYEYDRTEILNYNEIQYVHGPEHAKAWADRRWHERDRK